MSRGVTITDRIWDEYIAGLRRINDRAAEEMLKYLNTHAWYSSESAKNAAIDYAFALSEKYGSAAAALACDMYQAVVDASFVYVPAAEPAATATMGEVAKAVQGTMKTGNSKIVADAVGRLVKMAGVDTTMQNAIRDGAEWAWVPRGMTCAFCVTLASRGWQRASRKALNGGHAEHIHANCDCTYAIRFNSDTTVAGYEPDKYLEMYNAQSGKPQDRINAMRRAAYAENKERGLLALDSSVAEEIEI